jgi:hypothetical protein
MFLTPFIDFGEPIEKLCGLSVARSSSTDWDDGENQTPSASNRPPLQQKPMETAVPTRARIVGVSDKLKIVSTTDKGTKMEGSGIAIGSGPLDQSKAYFEIAVEAPNTKISVGAIGRNPNIVLAEGWQVLSKIPNTICVPVGTYQPGDVLGALVDISNFPPSVTGYESNDVERKSVSASVRGDLWPALEVHSGSATVVFNRDELKYLSRNRLSRGVEAVMISRSII